MAEFRHPSGGLVAHGSVDAQFLAESLCWWLNCSEQCSMEDSLIVQSDHESQCVKFILSFEQNDMKFDVCFRAAGVGGINVS